MTSTQWFFITIIGICLFSGLLAAAGTYSTKQQQFNQEFSVACIKAGGSVIVGAQTNIVNCIQGTVTIVPRL